LWARIKFAGADEPVDCGTADAGVDEFIRAVVVLRGPRAAPVTPTGTLGNFLGAPRMLPVRLHPVMI